MKYFIAMILISGLIFGCQPAREQKSCISYGCKPIIDKSEKAYIECVKACSTISKKDK